MRNKCLSNSSFKKWHKEFKDGRRSLQNAPQCGRPRTSVTEINTNTVASIIENDRHLFTGKLTSLLNMSKMSVNCMLMQELKIKRVCFVWVPHLLKLEQMGFHSQLAKKNLKKLQKPDYRCCERVITVEKLWIHRYNPKLKHGNETWLRKGDQQHQKVWQQKSMGKVQLEVFFDCRGMIYQQICPPRQRINRKYYTTILK